MLRRLLAFQTRLELDDFLKAHDIPSGVTVEELDRQMRDPEKSWTLTSAARYRRHQPDQLPHSDWPCRRLARLVRTSVELHADLVLVDDPEAVAVARGKGLRVAGTLTIVAMAAEKGLLNLPETLDRLKRTSFHYRKELIDRFLADYRPTRE